MKQKADRMLMIVEHRQSDMASRNFFTRVLGPKCICVAALFLCGVWPLLAQELNAVVLVRGDRVQGVERRVFNRLENDLRSFLNGRKWLHASAASDEKVNCSFTLVITDAPASGVFVGELYVQSFRHTANSEYASPLLNMRDKTLEFDYTEHRPLQFDINFIQDNLTATFAYYAYLVLGLDLDSRAPLGGTDCFRIMRQIASSAQSSAWKGWGVDSRKGRAAIAVSLNDAVFEPYRRAWCDYHSNGLDVSEVPADVKAEKVLLLLRSLKQSQEVRPGNVLVRMFGDAKLEELSSLLAQASEVQRESIQLILRELYPARTDILNLMR